MSRDNKVGELLREAISADYVIEEAGWAVERVQRVAGRLQARTPIEQRLEVLVPWLDEHTAFTAPGRYIYFSRRLLERCRTDEMAAMVIAHEIAHHELGHVKLPWPRVLPVGLLLARLRRIHRRQRDEVEADRRAIELCVDAGYAPDKCLELFSLLSHIALDYGDTVGVFGPKDSRLRRGSHPPLCEREQAVRDHLSVILAARSTGEGPLRQTTAREHCGHCDRDVVAPCAHCRRPLCRVHDRAGPTCFSCKSTPRPLCRVCRRSSQCLRCGISNRCRYCRSEASVRCSRCDKVFCRDHAPRRTTLCVSCRVDDLVVGERRSRNVQIAIATIAFLVIAILLGPSGCVSG